MLLSLRFSPGRARHVSDTGFGQVDIGTIFDRAADQLDPDAAHNRVFEDPALWCRINIAEYSLTAYQEEVMQNVVTYGRESVRGPHGLGKTTCAAHLILWFADTRERAGIDWKVVVTASVWRQLEKYLWPEVHKWARKLVRPYTRDQLFQLKLKLTQGEAFAVASDQHEAIEGAHADHILYVYDEAKAIPPSTYDATEGAFAGAEADLAGQQKAYALAISTPGESNGRFFEIHVRKPGYEDWHVTHVTLDDAIAAGRISRTWAEQRAKQWGVNSTVYQNRVLGEFAADDADGVIPSLAWVEAAQSRWVELSEAPEWPRSRPNLTCVSADVARQGADKTVIATRYMGFVDSLTSQFQEDTTTTKARVAARLGPPRPGVYATVDVIGIGAGVVDQLRMDHYEVIGFNGAEGTPLTDSSGELAFSNKRAAAWWNMRELLDPSNGFDIALPPDEELIGDLLAPKWRVLPGGRIQIERKDDIISRLGRSPDRGDAVVMSFWDPDNEANEEYVTYAEDVVISAF